MSAQSMLKSQRSINLGERRVVKCELCKSEEGKPRPVGQFIVKLKPAKISGIIKQVCQVCFRKHSKLRAIHRWKPQKKTPFKKILIGKIFEWELWLYKN